MYYVYVLWSKENHKFYLGYTSDLRRRINEHGKGAVHTTCRMAAPTLIFYEAFRAEKDARRREKYFKTTKGKRSSRLILRESITQP